MSERPIAEVVSRLSHILGSKLVAYIVGEGDTQIIEEYIWGEKGPSREVGDRLRLALWTAEVLGGVESQATVQSWFQGLNPLLDGVSPARFLREMPFVKCPDAMTLAIAEFVCNG